METSRPLKVDMNAANAPAQVMPLRIEPHGMRLRAAVAVEAEDETGGRREDELATFPSSHFPVFLFSSFRMRGSSSTTLSVPFAPAPAYNSGARLRPITPNTGGKT